MGNPAKLALAIKTMPASIAAQELAFTSKKRKRESSREAFNAAQFVNGQSSTTPQLDVKGKGKARDVLLGEEGITGSRAEHVCSGRQRQYKADTLATGLDSTSRSTANLWGSMILRTIMESTLWLACRSSTITEPSYWTHSSHNARESEIGVRGYLAFDRRT